MISSWARILPASFIRLWPLTFHFSEVNLTGDYHTDFRRSERVRKLSHSIFSKMFGTGCSISPMSNPIYKNWPIEIATGRKSLVNLLKKSGLSRSDFCGIICSLACFKLCTVCKSVQGYPHIQKTI